MQAPVFTYIELEHVDCARNAHRYYRLAWESNLLGQACLVRVWGRKGSPKRQRVTHFPTWTDAWPTVRALLRTRLRHGYRVVAGTLPPLPAPAGHSGPNTDKL